MCCAVKSVRTTRRNAWDGCVCRCDLFLVLRTEDWKMNTSFAFNDDREQRRQKRLSDIRNGSKFVASDCSPAMSPYTSSSPRNNGGSPFGTPPPQLSSSLSMSQSAIVPKPPAAPKGMFDDAVTSRTEFDREVEFVNYSEAVYRRHIATEMDAEFCTIVECSWDEFEVLQLIATEAVRRFWLVSEMDNGSRSILAIEEDDRTWLLLRHSMDELAKREEIDRIELIADFHDDLSAVAGEETREYLIALRSQRRREDSILPEESSTIEQQESASTGLGSPLHRADTAEPTLSQVVSEVSSPEPTPPSPLSPKPPASTVRLTSGQRAMAAKYDVHRDAVRAIREDAKTTKREAALLEFVCDGETKVRLAIETGYWQAVHKVLAPGSRRLAMLAVVGIEQWKVIYEELAERHRIVQSYFTMMLQAVECLEILGRRSFMYITWPDGQESFTAAERQSWIDARKREQDRFKAEEMEDVETREATRRAFIRWSDDRLQERLTLSRSETEDRLALMHESNGNWAVLAYTFEAERSVIAPVQVEFEMAQQRLANTVVWSKETYYDVYLREYEHRQSVMAEEKERWAMLCRTKESCLLVTLRNWRINSEVAVEMQHYDLQLPLSTLGTTAIPRAADGSAQAVA